jgi:hypothetical protein
MSLHDDLHRALKPVDPGPEFTARVLAAIEADARPEGSRRADDRTPDGRTFAARAEARRDGGRAFRRQWARRAWMWPALAASLVGAVVGVRWFEVQRETERGLAARAQVMQALRLTTEKLNVAREVVAESGARSSHEAAVPR